MTRPKVLLIGATGNVGGSILEALLAADQFDIEILIRPNSATKPSVQALTTQRGIPGRIVDLDGPEDELVPALAGVDILIVTVGPALVAQQKKLVWAAKRAGVQRFVPSSYITIAPPRGAMLLREMKEEIINEIKLHNLGYTIIDVGYWYQLSCPPLPSGRIDYAIPLPDATRTVHGAGDAPNILIDLADIGRYVARILADARTLNRYVYLCGEVLTENQVLGVVEEMAGEEVDRIYEPLDVTTEKALQAFRELEEARSTTGRVNPDDEDNWEKLVPVLLTQYRVSKYVRQDNQPHVAEYLGYLDARQLYPDLRPRLFREFFAEMLAGKGRNPYAYA
ncbi:isoflavone reductase family protein [Aspergillus saccharolyticus JOP 1030-1]|uniref:Isoflavone reductase family protein n=1 Tax=Aspergillus saccharolyticus JOP 1030-1 TaxID=1450539 RepID=A0A318ZMA7_9EURO|nr:isoflavone reductase family protein [Aspergillus saccharolyticus JOP 1030-1]PYH48761.1 isoflavone reductase family protein [Aspergillus saccharolyticus JOP 1030-1]